MYNVNHQQHRKEICKWCVKLFEPCLDPNGSGRELSMFDKLDVRHCKGFELYDSS
jgi:Pyruvate/2-oxoacid:ferredoxin oxidoreductase delta subunit